MSFEVARKVADAVLYEGYALYPYRASSQKNQSRWQFGVVVPRSYAESGSSESWSTQTECVVEATGDTVVSLRLRFLQLQSRVIEERGEGAEDWRRVPSLEVDGEMLLTWDEAVEREVDAAFPMSDLLGEGRALPFGVAGGREVEPLAASSGAAAGRIVRERWPLSGVLDAQAVPIEGPYGVVRLQVRVSNTTRFDEHDAPRDVALRRSLIAAHTIMVVTGGAFISLLEPQEWARPAVESCTNLHTWPVLVGAEDRRDVMLSSPIILYDYPEIAPESQGDLFDATEIDEILSLRTLALTDEEKREARATDPRAREIIDRVDAMPPELFERLHGAVRYVRGASPGNGGEAEQVPWWDPGADASVDPDNDFITVDGVAVRRGSRVRLRPGLRRTDAQDMFLAGRVGTVEAVLFDVDEDRYVAVTLEDDPAADLQRWHGRFLYFHPEEIEPLGSSAPGIQSSGPGR
jgi:hypothetical protein